jgi:hypothetical protein
MHWGWKLYIAHALLIMIVSAPFLFGALMRKIRAPCSCCGGELGWWDKAWFSTIMFTAWLLHSWIWFISLPWGFYT